MRKDRIPMPSSAHKPLKILAIDDEPVVRDSISAYLEDSGFEVLQAGDGQEERAAKELHETDFPLMRARGLARFGSRSTSDENRAGCRLDVGPATTSQVGSTYHAVRGGGGAAPLQVAKNGDARLQSGELLQLS